MQSTRASILAYLETHPAASAVELSRAVGKTPANIRHHLRQLTVDGRVEIVGQQRKIGRGRPVILYGLTARVQQQDLGRLIGALWREAVGDQTPNRRLTRFRRMARTLAGPGVAPGGNLTIRLTEAVRRLRKLNYQARWEAHAEAPRLILEHCPYAALLDQLPELCQLDACLLEELIGSAVIQVSGRKTGLSGVSPCIFQIQSGE